MAGAVRHGSGEPGCLRPRLRPDRRARGRARHRLHQVGPQPRPRRERPRRTPRRARADDGGVRAAGRAQGGAPGARDRVVLERRRAHRPRDPRRLATACGRATRTTRSSGRTSSAGPACCCRPSSSAPTSARRPRTARAAPRRCRTAWRRASWDPRASSGTSCRATRTRRAAITRFAALYKELRPVVHGGRVLHPELRDPAWRATAFVGADGGRRRRGDGGQPRGRPGRAAAAAGARPRPPLPRARAARDRRGRVRVDRARVVHRPARSSCRARCSPRSACSCRRSGPCRPSSSTSRRSDAAPRAKHTLSRFRRPGIAKGYVSARVRRGTRGRRPASGTGTPGRPRGRCACRPRCAVSAAVVAVERGVDGRRRADGVHEGDGVQGCGIRPLRHVHAVEVRQRLEHPLVGAAVHRQVAHDLLVGVVAGEADGALEVAEERHIGHDGHEAVGETRRRDGDAAALAGAADRHPVGVDLRERAHGVDRAHGIREDPAVVVRRGVLDAAGHEAATTTGRCRADRACRRPSPTSTPGRACP